MSSSKTSTKTHEPTASPRFLTAALKPAEIAALTRKTAEVVKAHPSYPQNPALQACVTSWVAAGDAIDHDEQDLKNAHSLAAQAAAKRVVHVSDWKRETKRVLAEVDRLAAGSPTEVKAWGFGLSTRVVTAPTSDPPADLRVHYKRDLSLVIRWKAVAGSRGYSLQMGDGTPQGWGPIIQCPAANYTPVGLTPGQHLTIRVAVQRKSGLSAWSDALSAVAR